METLVTIGEPAIEPLKAALKYNLVDLDEAVSALAYILSDYFKVILKVCSGEGVPEAASYHQNDPGPHPVILVIGNENTAAAAATFSWRSYILPLEWWPDTLEEAELVVCINSRDVFIGSCGYFGGYTLEQYRGDFDVTLYEATTGLEISRTTIWNTIPGTCSGLETFTEGGYVKKEYGKFPDTAYSNFEAWLKPYVE